MRAELYFNQVIVKRSDVAQHAVNTTLTRIQNNLDAFRKLLESSPRSNITEEYLQKQFAACLKFPPHPFQVKGGAAVRDDLRAASLACGMIILESTFPNLVERMTKQDIIKKYRVSAHSTTELDFLIEHARYSRLGMFLLKAEKNKKHYLAASTKIVEGLGVRYITGSGQKAETQRRVGIFEKETGVVPERRPDRKFRPRGRSVSSEESRGSLLTKAGRRKSKISELSIAWSEPQQDCFIVPGGAWEEDFNLIQFDQEEDNLSVSSTETPQEVSLSCESPVAVYPESLNRCPSPPSLNRCPSSPSSTIYSSYSSYSEEEIDRDFLHYWTST